MSQELKLRIASALVLAPLILWITWLGGYAFVALWAVTSFLILSEYTQIIKPKLIENIKPASFAALAAVILGYLFAGVHVAMILFCLFLIVFCVWEYSKNKSIWAAGGLVYSALPFIALSELRGDSHQGLVYVVILFACVWGADIFAYFTGRTLQGPKLAPKISPNKTWSGFIGSLVGALALSSLYWIYEGGQITPRFLLIILVVAITSQIGDLVESSLKRKFGIKDSGTIIPGHGGVLDRLDGFIPASVMLWMIVSMSKEALI